MVSGEVKYVFDKYFMSLVTVFIVHNNTNTQPKAINIKQFFKKLSIKYYIKCQHLMLLHTN